MFIKSSIDRNTYINLYCGKEETHKTAGLWAISAGLSYNYKNDFEMLSIGMKIYDALFSWAKYVQTENHRWDPDILNKQIKK